MKLAHAVWASVGLHAAAGLWVLCSGAHPDTAGLARPPVSILQARIFTYQKGDSPGVSAPPEAPATQSEPRPAEPLLPSVGPATPRVTAEPVPPHAAADALPDSAALDSSPVLLSEVTLEYPLAANNREGLVTLALVIGGNGTVEEVSVVKAVPPGYFEAAAVAGFRKARFTPGLLGGMGVKSRMLVEVEFMPTNRGGAVSGQR